jgi:hypothetical protein
MRELRSEVTQVEGAYQTADRHLARASACEVAYQNDPRRPICKSPVNRKIWHLFGTEAEGNRKT